MKMLHYPLVTDLELVFALAYQGEILRARTHQASYFRSDPCRKIVPLCGKFSFRAPSLTMSKYLDVIHCKTRKAIEVYIN